MSSASSVPKLRLHKPTGQAYVRLHRAQKPIYLGKFGTTDAEAKYYRALAEWRSGQSLEPAPPDEITVAELVARFWDHAKIYYRYPDGRPTPELSCLKAAIQPLLTLYADEPCSQFGPKALKAVRTHMVGLGWCRKQINKQIGRIRLLFRWGTEEELVPPGIHQALAAVRGLQQGRSEAPERAPIGPAPTHLIDAIDPHVSQTINDMIRLQLLCGGRPQDIVNLRPMDIDRSGDVWVATLPQHKTAWRGHKHRLFFGPQAQSLLAPYLLRRPAESPVFSPAESAADRREVRTAARTTPLSCGNRPGTNVKSSPARGPGEGFTVPSYCRAITRACDAAFPLPAELAPRVDANGKPETAAAWRARLGAEGRAAIATWRRQHRFTPNQLRHTAATELRRQYGIDVAQTFLGHKLGSVITEIYAEANVERALAAARATG